MTTALIAAESDVDATTGQPTPFPPQAAENLLTQHDELLAKLVDDAQDHPLTHINPYVLLELIRQQSAWLHRLEQRVRALEEPF